MNPKVILALIGTVISIVGLFVSANNFQPDWLGHYLFIAGAILVFKFEPWSASNESDEFVHQWNLYFTAIIGCFVGMVVVSFSKFLILGGHLLSLVVGVLMYTLIILALAYCRAIAPTFLRRLAARIQK